MQVRVTVLWSCQRIYTTLTPFSSTFSLPFLYPPLPSPFTRSTLIYPLHNSTSTSSPLYFLSTISYLLFILASTSPVLGSSSSYPPPPYTPSSLPTYSPKLSSHPSSSFFTSPPPTRLTRSSPLFSTLLYTLPSLLRQ